MPVFVTLACMLAICAYRYIEVWTPLERFYFTTYIRSALRSATSSARTGEYELLAVTTKHGSHWASDGEVTDVKTASGEATLALTPQALKAGALHLVLAPVQANDAKIREFLRNAIYGDQTLTGFLQPALWVISNKGGSCQGIPVLFFPSSGTPVHARLAPFRVRRVVFVGSFCSCPPYWLGLFSFIATVLPTNHLFDHCGP